jgi:hypothetical protein
VGVEIARKLSNMPNPANWKNPKMNNRKRKEPEHQGLT